MSEEKLNLYQKLAKIRSLCDAAKKSKEGYGYTYTDIVEILANVTGGMKKYHISLIPTIVPGTAFVRNNPRVKTKLDRQGNAYEQKDTEMLFCADMVYKWVNDDEPSETIEVPWFVTGAMSDSSQSLGSGLTYTLRQFLTSYFQIAQSDNDPDAYRSKQKAAEDSEDLAIAASLIEQFDVLVRQYLADHEDKGEDVKKFISKYAKNAKYHNIKEPTLAAKLLSDFKSNFQIN